MNNKFLILVLIWMNILCSKCVFFLLLKCDQLIRPFSFYVHSKQCLYSDQHWTKSPFETYTIILFCFIPLLLLRFCSCCACHAQTLITILITLANERSFFFLLSLPCTHLQILSCLSLFCYLKKIEQYRNINIYICQRDCIMIFAFYYVKNS